MKLNLHFCLVFLSALILSGCKVENDYPTRSKDLYKYGSVTGSQGFLLSGDPEKENPVGATDVNKFLWHGAIETLSFAPLASCDVQSGVILTEWYQLENAPNESFKTTIHIKSKELRADALHVQIHKRVKTAGGQWTAAPISPEVTEKLENAILTQAKKLRQKEKKS